MSNSEISINNSLIKGNKAYNNPSRGGGIYAINSSLKIINTSILENKVSASADSDGGGGIFSISPNFTLTTPILDTVCIINSNISNNSTLGAGRGGGIYASNLNIAGTLIHKNSSNSGGGIHVSNSLKLNNSIVNGNDARDGGGIFAFGICDIVNSEVCYNIAEGVNGYIHGGGIYFNSNSQFNEEHLIYNSKINNNMVICSRYNYPANSGDIGAYGGGVYAHRKTKILKSEIANNSIITDERGFGGGLFCVVDSMFIESSIIKGNTCSSQNNSCGGGGICNTSSSYTLIKNSTISYNSSTSSGGGLLCSSGGSHICEVNVENSTIMRNSVLSISSAYSRGGGVLLRNYHYSPILLNITNSTIARNSSVEGSGIYTHKQLNGVSTYCKLSIKNTSICRNQSTIGGGISLYNSPNFTIGSSIVALNSNGDISGNISTNNGDNIFGNSPIGSVASDQVNVNSNSLNLGPLQYNNSPTYTMLPQPGSVAIDMGSSTDITNAQNGPIVGRRDVGAAEYGTCSTTENCISVFACQGSFYDFNGFSIINSGIYSDTLQNIGGCDSIIILNITFTNFTIGEDIQIACDSFTWINGVTYTESNNIATHILQSVYGCDSLVALNLTINGNIGTDTQVACESHTWIDGITYTQSNNTATHTLQNINGCDSLVTLDLIIHNSTTGVDTQIACNSYTWINGVEYTQNNNTATHTLQSIYGCDSIVTLNLTVGHTSNSVDSISTCGPYTWIDGNTYVQNNDTATYILQDIYGCDSIVTINLIINNSITDTDTQIACESFTWIDGITYTQSNNIANYTLQSIYGCDSIVNLDLTIYNIDTTTSIIQGTISSNEFGSEYQWLNCDNNYSIIQSETNQTIIPSFDGNYSVEVTNSFGCVDTSDCVLIDFTNIIKNVSGSLSVYPNPTSSVLNINTENSSVEEIKIYNMLGEVIDCYKQMIPCTISFEKYPKGGYYVRINSNYFYVVRN